MHTVSPRYLPEFFRSFQLASRAAGQYTLGFPQRQRKQEKVPYLIFWSSDNAWLMLFNVWNPSLTTVVLILSFVTATGFSNMAGHFIFPLLPISSPLPPSPLPPP